ncbi:hypothetical protein McanMca71_007718 [Microsporum canis]
MSPTRSEIINSHPIGDRLDTFEDLYGVCQPIFDSGAPISVEGDMKDNAKNRVLDFLVALPTISTCRILRSARGSGALYTDILRIAANFEVKPLLPLLKAVRDKEPDETIWDKVYEAVTESTPLPCPLSFRQTPWSRNTGSSINSNEYRTDTDNLLKEELDDLYIDIPGFYDVFFRDTAEQFYAQEVFERCKEGDDPLYREGDGWTGWPEDAKERPVLTWMSRIIGRITQIFEEHTSSEVQRRPLAQPHTPLKGSTADRKLDVGFVDNPEADENSRCHWSQILVLGELKNDQNYDIQSRAWLDLGRYVREVLAAQDSRLFVPGFTLCGSYMRLWHFDRLGGVASEKFNIHEEGLRFISVILAYLLMSEEQLGFDSTIITADGLRYIEIQRDGGKERLVIDEIIRRTACISGRATTCWKVHREGDESQAPLVVKNSWQYPERDEEGKLLREATEKGVVNVARYYHHATVPVGGRDCDIRDGVRRGLDITTASNYKPAGSRPPLSRSGSRKGKSSRVASRKRSSTYIEPSLPPSKRSQSYPLSPPNRIYRQVIIQDYGKPIYRASSRVALLAALEGCIEGYESLYRLAGMLQRDISPNNLIINEDADAEDISSWKSFIIDLDLAIKEDREDTSGARGKTGTRAFMAIGVLLDDEQHSFMHDLESFFWVLFWICIHHDSPEDSQVVKRFEKWNFMDTEELADMKIGIIAEEDKFLKTTTKYFTEYYQPLVPWVNRLRREVFPSGGRWKTPNKNLYSSMREILREAQKDPDVIGLN